MSADAAANPMQDRLAAAIAQHRAGKLAEAERAYRDILAEESGNADALHLLGALKQQSGKPDKSIALVRQAIALKPNSALYHNTLGIAYGMTRAVDWAVEAFTKAAALSPQYPDPHVHLGNIMRMQGRQGRSGNASGARRRDQAGFRGGAQQSGHAADRYGAVAQGRKPSDDRGAAAAEESRRSPSTLRLPAGPSIQKRRSPACRMCLAVNPGHPAALTNLGAIYSDLGERELALDCLRQALAAAPGNPQIKLDLANALSQFGDSREAKALYTEIAGESAPPKRLPASDRLGGYRRARR